MRMNRKKAVVAAALALGILTGCGASAGSTASSAASSAAASEPASSVAASSEVSSEENTAADGVHPIADEESDLDGLKNGEGVYQVRAAITNVKDDSVTLAVYGYDAYMEEDLETLQAGGTIYAHDDQTGTLEAVTINSLEKDEYGDYIINGGIEEGGIELTQDRGVFRTITFDGYPVYFKIGDVTLPLAEDVTLEDSSADPNASEVQTTGAADVASAIADSDDWSVYNTTVFVQDGHVYDIQHIWVP